MHLDYLDFEQPIAELEAKINELRLVGCDTELNLVEEIERLTNKSKSLTESVFAKLTPWQKVQLARHPCRPYAMDYIQQLFTEFDECQGDRQTSKGGTIIGGIARFHGQPVMVLGQQKGRKTQEKLDRNFGMPKPADYRKALRLMTLAERYKLPVITFIDTPGAYPGIDAEARNQSEAIARNLYEMSALKTPIICVIIGEGGSGGALALGVGDHVMMLQYSIYSVISPEGCASILWKSAEKAAQAAEALGVTADRLTELKLVDQMVEEPLGGAHRDSKLMAQRLDHALTEALARIQALPQETLLQQRYERLMLTHFEANT